MELLLKNLNILFWFAIMWFFVIKKYIDMPSKYEIEEYKKKKDMEYDLAQTKENLVIFKELVDLSVRFEYMYPGLKVYARNSGELVFSGEKKYQYCEFVSDREHKEKDCKCPSCSMWREVGDLIFNHYNTKGFYVSHYWSPIPYKFNKFTYLGENYPYIERIDYEKEFGDEICETDDI